MKYREIAERVRFHKQEEKGAQTMCRIFEEYGNEREEAGRERERIFIAENLLRDGSMSIERIASVSHLTLEQVKEIAKQISIE